MYILFLKIATRYLLKNKLYSFINIFGLAIGIASFVLIMLYVNYERSYDKFEGSENVYRVYMDYMEGDKFVPSDAQVYNLSGPTLKSEFAEVQEFVRFYHFDEVTFVYKDIVLGGNTGALADPSYFEIFKYPLISGDVKTALKEPNTIVLTESLANKIFGKEDPMGKSISVFWGGKVFMTVTGILKDIPNNTHMKNSFLISFNTFMTWDTFQGQQSQNWDQNNFFTYLKVDKNADMVTLRTKIQKNNADGQDDERHDIEPLEDIHLYSNKPYEAEANGSISRVHFLTAIAFIVLLLSWLNYINLASVKSLERAKETGIRKVAGAQRSQLLGQSFVESVLLNGIAITIAIALVVLVLPIFNNYIGTDLEFDVSYFQALFPIFGIVILGSLLSGLYPAFVVSGYNPSKALKGKMKTSQQSLYIRKGLITLQFLSTIVLLIGTFVVNKQIKFLREQPIGVDLNNIIALNGEVLDKNSDSLLIKNFGTLKQEIKKLPFVKAASTAETYPGAGYANLSYFAGITKPDGTFDEKKIYYQYQVQPDYFNVLDIQLVAGEIFRSSKNGYGDEIVINEKFAQDIGFTKVLDAVGKTVEFWNKKWIISGVMKNYHHFGLKMAIQPIAIRQGNATGSLLVKLNSKSMSKSDLTSTMVSLENQWKSVFPQSTFNYTFLDQNFEAQYKEDKAFGSAFQIFTILAILIASMGLFGLTSYTCIQRRKEIGIRKVNGATITQILKLLNKDFVKWVGLAFIIAVPISWYAMHKWLEGFAYKTDMSWWIFALAGVTALLIALLTVSWQSFRAATNNPVDALRDE